MWEQLKRQITWIFTSHLLVFRLRHQVMASDLLLSRKGEFWSHLRLCSWWEFFKYVEKRILVKCCVRLRLQRHCDIFQVPTSLTACYAQQFAFHFKKIRTKMLRYVLNCCQRCKTFKSVHPKYQWRAVGFVAGEALSLSKPILLVHELNGVA